ncbi:MAG: S1-C subfamily serine protease [Myxococcota bacterium]|jgi:S1-C subfamily serine protease
MIVRKRWTVLVALLVMVNAGLLGWIVFQPGEASGRNQLGRAPIARTALGDGEQRVVDLFERLSPSVVFITTHRVVRNRWRTNVQQVPQGSGSGFVWDTSGHVVTNLHVIAGASSALVTLADGSEWEATLVGVEPDHDLAVLRIEAPKSVLHPIPVGTSKDLRVGQFAMAIGNPFGLDQSLTTGVVSALDREIESASARKIFGVIQTDAAINPGNSGGPLIDSAGRLIGVNTAIQSPSGASAGIGFAVPVDTVNRLVPQLIRHGKAARPGLGIRALSASIAARFGVRSGVVVREVSPRGPAQRVGLVGLSYGREGKVRLGDVIVGVDDSTVRDFDDLSRVLDEKSVGDKVTVKVSRDGALREVVIALTSL